jgi:hypothetical protein
MWWHTPVKPALRRQRQGYHKFKTSLSYKGKPCLKIKKKNKIKAHHNKIAEEQCCREKDILCRGVHTGMITGLPYNIFRMLKKRSRLRIPYPVKTFRKTKVRLKTFSDKQRLREFIAGQIYATKNLSENYPSKRKMVADGDMKHYKLKKKKKKKPWRTENVFFFSFLNFLKC